MRVVVKSVVLKSVMVLAAAVLLSTPALATPVQYAATAAIGDEWSNSSGGHAFWFPGLATDLVFTEPGAFIDHGSFWTLTGHVYSESNAAVAFDVDMVFGSIGPSADRKLELKDGAYAANGGPVDPDTWIFAHDLRGTFTGSFGDVYDGDTLTVGRRGPPAQFGEGANGKNINNGMSSWLTADGAHQEDEVRFVGDVNIDLDRPPIPEPGAALLFAAGALIVGGALRRP